MANNFVPLLKKLFGYSGKGGKMKMKSAEDEELLESAIDEQRREFAAAGTLDPDLRFAFDLQMQEAITASLLGTSQPSTSTAPPPPPHLDVDGYEGTSLLLENLGLSEQERLDQLPEANKTGSFRMYCKGIVSEEIIKDRRVSVASIGVAICDFQDNLLFEMNRGLENGELLSNEGAELEALVAGLEAAVALNLERLNYFFDSYIVYQYVSGKWLANQSNIATLVYKVIGFKKRFTFCEPSYLGRNEIKFAFKLAREAIISQISWSVETGAGKGLKETCAICFEDIDVARMHSIDGCLHRYCFSCMKQHVEAKLLAGKMAQCPHECCKTTIDLDTCGKFLDPHLVEIISNRMEEASIAVTNKVYCPYPKCSHLMSKPEVLAYTRRELTGTETSPARKCMKCKQYFCLECNVPWHYNMTCQVYQSSPRPPSDESVVKALASKKKWRQCVKCNNMVELASGCYHIYCRCGHQFCYTCGAEWKNKKATCECVLWDERNIIRKR